MTNAQPSESRADRRRPQAPGQQRAAARLRRRHGAQRHARPGQAPRQAPSPVHDPGRGPVSRRGAGLSGASRRKRLEAGLRAAHARVLVEGLSDRADARHVPVRAPGASRRAPSTPSRRRFDDDPEGACRQLFYDLLWFRTGEADPAGAGPLGLVEQSTDTIAAAPTLARLFPEAKFIHVVRDGRDASASRVAQTRGLIHPRTRRQGLEWWEERIRRIDAGEACDRTRPSAHGEPRRAPAGPHPSRPAAAVPVPRRLPAAADAGLLPAGDERRAGQHRALAPRPLGAPRRRARARLRGGRGGARGRSRALRAARAPHAGAHPGRGRRGAGAAPVRARRRATAGSLGEAGGRRRFGCDRERPRLRRRHRAQRHARDRQAARPALALRDGPDRVPLPLQSEWPRGRRHRQGDPGGVRGQAAQVLVAPGPSRRARPGARGVAGAAEAARCAASTRSLPRDRFEEAVARFEESCSPRRRSQPPERCSSTCSAPWPRTRASPRSSR